MIKNDHQGQRLLHDIHLERTGIKFDDPAFKFTGGDVGDGTYKNFILFSDYADPDVIRVDDDFYAVTSTFHLNPGVTILHSKDLVNWRIVGHAVDDMSKLHPDFSFNAMRAYGAGIWAPSIRRHDGMFFIHVGGPKIGLIVCKATEITGPWTVTRMKMKAPWPFSKLIDCCPFWDDDGKAYFAAAEPRRHMVDGSVVLEYKMHLFQMSPDGERLLDEGVLIHGGRTTEAIKLDKINGYYYVFHVEHPMDEDGMRTQFAARSKNVYGPYERRMLIHSHGPAQDMNPCQGGLVDAPDGTWWFLCHGMTGDSPAMSVGRPWTLLPVTWKDDWPIIGEDLDGDGVGEMVWRTEKPVQDGPQWFPATSDEFDDEELGLQWQWNHVPRNDLWSLTENSGSLRLKASQPVCPGGFYHARNTLTQRIIGDRSTATTALSTKGMVDGQYAGLCFMADPSQLLGVYMENGEKVIRYQFTKKQPVNASHAEESKKYFDEFFCVDIAAFDGEDLYLRAEHDLDVAKLSYSLDGETFQEAYEPLKFNFFAWRGGRIGFFTWNDFKEAGSADFDWFRYEFE